MSSEFKKNHGIFEDSIVLNSTDELRKIIQPLQSTLGIDYFSFARLYHDRSRIYLNPFSDFVRLYDSHLYQFGDYNKLPSMYSSGYHQWSSSGPMEIKTIMRDKFNIEDGMTIVDCGVIYTDIFIFCHTSEIKDGFNIYLNNFQLFQRFCVYFKQKANNIIKAAELSDRKILQCRELTFPFDCGNEIDDTNRVKEAFYLETRLNEFVIEGAKEPIKLTRRELDCVAGLLKNKTAKQLSKLLNISYRTIETHVNNLKMKLELHTREELINFFINHEISRYL